MARKTVFQPALLLVAAAAISGCASDGGGHTHGYADYGMGYYSGYYDPYPCWGCGGNTIIVNPPPERPVKPEHPIERPPIERPPVARPPVARPPMSRPSGGLGRPRLR